MRDRETVSALTIAGSDSGGGAGIQADLKTFAALGVHGMSAITCLTAQNPSEVRGIQAATQRMVRDQIGAVFSELPPQAAKTGMLYSAGIIQEIVRTWKEERRPPLVVDPVMVASSGARLLQPAAVGLIRDKLLPLATLMTPNLDEVEVLIGDRPTTIESLHQAARRLHNQFGAAALVKGGHLTDTEEAVDVYFDGKREERLSAPWVRAATTHGSGCAYSAAITAHLAQGYGIFEAVRHGKRFITEAMRCAVSVGRHSVLNFWVGEEQRSG